MNLSAAGDPTQTRTTPTGLKWILLFLLFASAIAGFASSAFLFKKSARLLPASIGQRFKPGAMNFSGFSNFVEKTDSVHWPSFSDGPVSCQGIMTGENGKSLAIINGLTVSNGVTVNGVKILEISRSNVLVECRGEPRRLAPGESFIPDKKK